MIWTICSRTATRMRELSNPLSDRQLAYIWGGLEGATKITEKSGFISKL